MTVSSQSNPLENALDWAAPDFERLARTEPDLLALVAFGNIASFHFVLATIAAIRSPRHGGLHQNLVRDWADFIAHAQRRKVIERAYGSCPESFLTLLKRVETHGLEADDYLRLHRVASHPQRRAMALSRDTLSSGDILYLASSIATRLPNEIQESLETSDYFVVVHLIQLVQARLRRGNLRNNLRLLRSLRSLEEFKSWSTDGLGVPPEFPSAPWPGDSEWRPVTTLQELRRIRDDARNCVMTRASRYMSGERVLYRSVNAPFRIVELARDVDLQWHVREIGTKRHRNLSDEERAVILTRFASLGFQEASQELLPIDEIMDLVTKECDGELEF